MKIILLLQSESIHTTVADCLAKNFGYDKSAISNFKDAKQVIGKLGKIVQLEIDRPDLIIADLDNDDIDFLEFVKTIRMMELYQKLPIIIIKSGFTREEVLECIEFAPVFLITRPKLTVSLLNEKLVKAFSHGKNAA